MMEKVVLTAKQAEAIEAFRKNGSSNAGILDNHFYKHYDGEFYKRLSDANIDTDRLVAALYIGYEIVETFKRGDKVVPVGTDYFRVRKVGDVGYAIGTVIETTAKGVHIKFEDYTKYVTDNKVCLASPEEIYWLETLGRNKVGDFKIGDAITTSEDNEICRVVDKDGSYDSSIVSMESAKKWHASGLVTGIYPAESFKPIPKEESK